MPEVENSSSEDTKVMIINIENELARFSLSTKSEDTRVAVKNCVYHVILRAISLAKDPNSNVKETKRLFNLAQEMIASADLDDESDLKARLGDLINAMVDQDDLSIQLRATRTQTLDYMKTVMTMLKRESQLRIEDTSNIMESLLLVKKDVNKMSKKRSALKMVLIVTAALLVTVFTILMSYVIIATLVNPPLSHPGYERSSQMMNKPVTPYTYEVRKPVE